MQESQTYRLAPLLALPKVPQYWLDEILSCHRYEPTTPTHAQPPWCPSMTCPYCALLGAGQLDVFPLDAWYHDGYDDDGDTWEEDGDPSASLQYGFGARCYLTAAYAQPVRWRGASPVDSQWRN